MRSRKYYLQLFITLTLICMAHRALASELDVKIKGSIQQRYDDNIDFAEDNEQADFITSIRVGAMLDYEDRRSLMSLDVNVIQNIFWDISDNTNTSQNTNFSYRYFLTRNDYITISDRFEHAYEASSFDAEFGRAGGRFDFFDNKFDITYLKTLSEESSIEFGYGYDTYYVDDDTRLDSQVNRASIEGSYGLNSRSTILGRFDLNVRDFDPGDNAAIYSISGGLRQLITDQLSVEMLAGVDFIDSFNGDDLSKPLWVVTVKDQITDQTSATLSYSQRYSTNQYTSDVFESWRVSAGIGSQLNRKLKATASTFYGEGEFDLLSIKDELFGIDIDLDYDLQKDTTGNLSYTYSQTTSNLDSREYKRNVVTLGVTKEF